VAATGFLPGVLSFLYALSHLERVAHKPSNMFFQVQPTLSPGESVLQLANKPHRVKHYTSTTFSGNPDTNTTGKLQTSATT
jgi:hypothetical protein